MRVLVALPVLVVAASLLLGSACAQTQLLEGPAPLAAEGGADTDAGEVDDGGPHDPELLAQGLKGVLDLAVDGNYVYAAAMDSQAAFAVPKAGGKAILLAHHTSAVLGITVDAERVYWGVAGITNDDSSPGMIASVPVTDLGSAPQTFKAAKQFAPFSPWSLAIDDARVYCGSASGVFAADKNTKVETVLGGGSVPSPVVVTQDAVYWVARLDGTLSAAPKTGGGSHVLVTGASQSITGVTADEARVYWLQNDGQRGRVYSMPVSGGDKTELASIAQTGYSMTSDAKYIYWTSLAGGNLNRVPKDGGAATLLAVNVVTPSLKGGAITNDVNYVYWSSGEGNVFRIHK